MRQPEFFLASLLLVLATIMGSMIPSVGYLPTDEGFGAVETTGPALGETEASAMLKTLISEGVASPAVPQPTSLVMQGTTIREARLSGFSLPTVHFAAGRIPAIP